MLAGETWSSAVKKAVLLLYLVTSRGSSGVNSTISPSTQSWTEMGRVGETGGEYSAIGLRREIGERRLPSE